MLEGEAVVSDHMLVPVVTLLWSPLLGLIVGVDEPETRAVAFSPFEVIDDRPHGISFDRCPVLDGSIHLEFVNLLKILCEPVCEMRGNSFILFNR